MGEVTVVDVKPQLVAGIRKRGHFPYYIEGTTGLRFLLVYITIANDFSMIKFKAAPNRSKASIHQEL